MKNKKKLLKYFLHGVVLVGLVLAAAKYLNGEEVINALKTFNYAFAPFVLLVSIVYIWIKGLRFVLLMRPLTDLDSNVIVKGYISGTAATLVPGGIAARAGLMQQAGVPVAKSSAPVAFSSILDQAAFLVGSLLAALFVEWLRVPALILLGIVFVLALILMIPRSREWLVGVGNRVAKKFKFLDQWRHFLKAVKEVFTWPIMIKSFAITLSGLLFQVIALDFTLRGMDYQVAYPTLFLAYILPAMLGRLSAIPAGVGLTEAGMVGFLSSAVQMDPDTAAAAAAVFRIATVFFHALLGAVIYFLFWKGEKEGVLTEDNKGG